MPEHDRQCCGRPMIEVRRFLDPPALPPDPEPERRRFVDGKGCTRCGRFEATR